MFTPLPNASAVIAETLTREGFRWIPGRTPSFEGEINENGFVFKVRIQQVDPTFLSLPDAYLIEKPKTLRTCLPHVEQGNKLCYLDPLGVFFDPFQPDQCILIVISAIRRLLRSFTENSVSTIQQELGGEFLAYWDGHYHCFLTSLTQDAELHFYRSQRLVGSERIECVVAENRLSAVHWSAKRNSALDDESISEKVLIVDMNGPPKAGVNRAWPPQNWLSFMGWLKEWHPEIESDLLRKLMVEIVDRTALSIIFLASNSGPFGVRAEFDPKVVSQLRRFRPESFRNLKPPQKKKRLDQFRQSIVSRLAVRSFKRLYVSDVTAEYIHSRNLQIPSLMTRKIALLGCGTVGSHAARLLVLAGAGSGKNGKLTLYDGDILKPGNLGRHLLSAKYLYESKAVAVADHLKQIANTSLSIESQGHFAFSAAQDLCDYDLVIDATGEETFSTLLAHWRNQHQNHEANTPMLLHSWIDAGGLAARGLLDDGTGACYRCLKVPEGGEKTWNLRERFPLFSGTQRYAHTPEAIQYRCGESYFPFAAGVATIAAGMTQLMALDAFETNPGPRFRHDGISSIVRNTKSQSPRPQKDCPCCQQAAT